MLQIRLKSVAPTEGSPGAKHLPAETVTVACPDHLVLADLPVAKGIGAATAASLVKTIGRRSRRQLGERVHFCVRCDFPIAIYGRLVCVNQPSSSLGVVLNALKLNATSLSLQLDSCRLTTMLLCSCRALVNMHFVWIVLGVIQYVICEFF